jgi:hypothetical protein
MCRRKATVREQAHDNPGSIGVPELAEFIVWHVKLERAQIWCHVKAAIRELVKVPVTTTIVRRQFLECPKYCALDGQHELRAKVSWKRASACPLPHKHGGDLRLPSSARSRQRWIGGNHLDRSTPISPPAKRGNMMRNGLSAAFPARCIRDREGRNKVVVEYALRDSGKPMGVAQYRLSPALPEQLKNDLPTAEDLASVTADDDSPRDRTIGSVMAEATARSFHPGARPADV